MFVCVNIINMFISTFLIRILQGETIIKIGIKQLHSNTIKLKIITKISKMIDMLNRKRSLDLIKNQKYV